MKKLKMARGTTLTFEEGYNKYLEIIGRGVYFCGWVRGASCGALLTNPSIYDKINR